MFFFSFSCNAVNDLFRGRNLDNVVNKLAELWEILFRVRDDIKVNNLQFCTKLYYTLNQAVMSLSVLQARSN